MADNDGKLVLELDIPKTASQINADIKKLQKQLAHVKATGALDTSATVRKINAQISALQSQLKAIAINADADTADAQRTGQEIGQTVADAAQRAVDNEKIHIDRLSAEDAGTALEGCAQELERSASLSSLNQADEKLEETESSMHGLKKLGASLKDQLSQAAQSLSESFSLSSAVTLAVSKTKDAVADLKEINTLLTEISKTNSGLSKSDLDRIGSNSFDIAGRYGKSAADYLSGVQEASSAGYRNAEAVAELSLAAQGAGSMTADLSNQMIFAVDEAYKMNGSITELTKVLDGMHFIASRNSVNMTDLSEAMSIVGSTAASSGVDVDEAAAALGTMAAATGQSGQEAAHALKTILLNIRQVSDEEEGIDAEGLAKYEAACNALNVKLKETKNGVLSLRDPMEVLKELSVEYNKLEEGDSRRTNLLSSVGSKPQAAQLDALLRQWDTYESMLQQYADGTGSMAVAAEKTVNSWEGSLNRLNNTWKDIVGNVADSDGIITTINALNGLLSVVNHITDRLGSLGTIGTIGGAIAGAKGLG